jgi:endonuclease YncB( thermonuclease family)
MEGGEYLWQVQEVVAPTELKLKGSGQTIRVRLIGLEVAESETATVEDMLRRELKGEWLRIKVLRETPDGIKEGFAYLSGEDIHARLIRLGLAKISRQDQGFDIRTYIELELEARAAKRGRWANSNGGAE